MTQVFDLDGSERNPDWLAETFDGCTVLPANTTGATEVWRLAAIYTTEGPATFKAEVRRGSVASAGQPIAFTWPALDNPSADLDLLPQGPHHWSSRAVLQETNDQGLAGFGLGRTYGPFYHAWVVSSAPSDCLTKTGMKGSTNHRGPLHAVWILQQVEPAHDTLADALVWKGQQMQVIQFNPAASLQRRIFADHFVPNSPEFTQDFGGVRFVAQRAEHLGTGEVRIYYAPVSNFNDVAFVVRR